MSRVGSLPVIHDGVDTWESHDTDGPFERELRQSTSAEVRFDRGTRSAYSTDASNYRQVPTGVVVPRTIDDVVETVAICRRHEIPITSRGGGTSLAGQTVNSGLIIDFSKYLNEVVWIDPDERLAHVQPGCVLDDLREAAGEHGLTFGPDPATHDRNTLGGMIGNNSCGVHSVMSELIGPGPLTTDQVVELDVLTYDGHRMTVGSVGEEELERLASEGGRSGQIHRDLKDLADKWSGEIRERFPEIPRRVSGYNLPRLLPEAGFDVAKSLVGSEGTCVVILGATVRLIPELPERVLVVLGFDDVYEAADHVPEVMGFDPIAVEGIDSKLVEYMNIKGLHHEDIDMLPEGEGWLLVEFGADDRSTAEGSAGALMGIMNRREGVSVKKFDDPDEEERIWEIRESGLGATAHVPTMDRTHPGWEDSAVPPDHLGDYLRRFRSLLDEFDYDASFYGHFGQGCLHCRIDFDLRTPAGVDVWTQFLERAADLVAEMGGSFSGEHGDGQQRAALLGRMYGERLLEAFGRFKKIWDPEGMMNPGKVVDPFQPDENLREGPDYTPLEAKTHFAFLDDEGSFRKATERCVGVGACRDVRSGAMCPSYMATREEMDSTRGRARLLFELMRGEVIGDLWQSEEVEQALHLCLACKACKSECPVDVDMATYKAEFLSHHYQGRLRPRQAYTAGLIYWWARMASIAPGAVNFISSLPGVKNGLKRVAGVAEERDIPKFAGETFRAWLKSRGASSPVEFATAEEKGRVPELHELSVKQPSAPPLDVDRVIVWPDTFNNYLTPGPTKSTVEVLERAGYEVEIPPRPLCCGRPLYDFGMLDTAKRLWEQTLSTLRPFIEDGVPIVGVEPSCVAAFRDELPGLFPHDANARRLSESSYLLSEFLVRQQTPVPALNGEAIVQGHCQHDAVMGMDSEMAVLDAMGVDAELLDSGCCGMAGPFGFSDEKYEVSMRIGERVLLPRVREADEDTLIVANGYSCREQITQTTDREALHLAEVMMLADRFGPGGPRVGTPETHADRADPPERPSAGAAAAVGAGLVGVAAALKFLRSR